MKLEVLEVVPQAPPAAVVEPDHPSFEREKRLVTLRLLLPDGRTALAACHARQSATLDKLVRWSGYVSEGNYRECRVPAVNTVIEAEGTGSIVRLYMHRPSLDGTGSHYAETYTLTTDPAPATEATVKAAWELLR